MTARLSCGPPHPRFGWEAVTETQRAIVLQLVDRKTREMRQDKEIAYLTGRSEGVVKVYLFQARQKLEATRFGLALRILGGEFDLEEQL